MSVGAKVYSGGKGLNNVMFFCLSDLSVEMPFTLTHPKPPESPPPSRPSSAAPQGATTETPVDTNLIQLDTK